MELHAYTRTISDLFSVKKKYVVPRFQREYSWTEEQLSELWNDIISNIKVDKEENYTHEEYFIGSLVLVGDDKSVSQQIVDGQQRLTTLTILLSSLCQRFKELNKANIAQAIYENYIAGKDDDGEYYFKLENESPKPFFQTKIQHIDKETKESPQTEEEKTLWNSYEILSSYLSKDNLTQKFPDLNLNNESVYENLLKSIREQVVKYLKVIFITVGEEDEAYTIFETLNARGMNLSFVDLIKNTIFKDLKNKHPDDKAKTKWRNLRDRIVSRSTVGGLEAFIRHWWISRYSYVSADNVYKSFKKKWKKGEIESETFLNDLVKDSEFYLKITSPELSDWKQQEEKEIYRSLLALKIFNISVPRPFLISLFKAKENKLIGFNEFKNTLTFLEKFHFLFNAICSTRPTGIEGTYSKAARELFDSENRDNSQKTITDLKTKLKTRIPTKTIFVDKFSKLKYLKGYTNYKKLIQYIFGYIELVSRETEEFQPDSITLEHILSQSTKNKNDDKNGHIGDIGNLLPLSKELNEEADNQQFKAKLEIYKKSNFSTTKRFIDECSTNNKTSWTAKDIEKRTKNLAEYCYDEIWKI